MSHRSEDPTLIEWLRRLSTRVDKIERGSVRQNSVQIGKMVIEADNDNERLTIRHKDTGQVKNLPATKEVFGWAGTVTIGSNVFSAPACLTNNGTITKTVFKVITPTTTGDLTAVLHTARGGATITVTLPAGTTQAIEYHEVGVLAEESLWVELTGAGDGTAKNMSLTVIIDG